MSVRRSGVGAVLSSGSRSLRGQLRQANALGVHYVVIVGDDELANKQVSVRDMINSGQVTKPLEQFLSELDAEHS